MTPIQEVHFAIWLTLSAEGRLERILGTRSKVFRVEHELALPGGGSADFVLSHVDGGLSILQVRPLAPRSEILKSIDQLAALVPELEHSRSPRYIIRYLFVPSGTDPAADMAIADACGAEVDYIGMGPIATHRENWRKLADDLGIRARW